MQTRTVLSFVISGLIISLVGSIIFIFATPPQSYVLFSLFFLLAATATITVVGKTIIFKIPLKGNYVGTHVFLIIATITLVILRLANIWIGTIDAILYVIVLIFALGFFVLEILKFKPISSRIEHVALAYPLSIASLAIIGTITLILPSNLRGISTLLVVTFLSVVSLFVMRKEKQTGASKHGEIIIKNNELIIAATLVFFIFFFLELYPRIATIFGLDIEDNFLYALALTKGTPGNFYYLNAIYPLFNVFQSSMIYIAKPSVGTFQFTFVFLNIFTIPTFYAMASQYLKRYGDHTPAIATLIWALFAGFGWLSFLTQKIGNPGASFLSLIGQTDVLSYGDITWRRLFFYLSMETTLTLAFAVLYFLKRNDLSKTRQVLLMTLLITPIPLLHPYGTYFLLPALLCFTVVCAKELKPQIKSTGYSLIIAAFALFPLTWILNIKGLSITISILTFSESLALGLIMVIITSVEKTLVWPNSVAKKLLEAKRTRSLIPVLFLLCFASLLLWFSGNMPFDFSNLSRFGYVPLFLYPVKLGIAGILTIATLYLLFVNPQYRQRELGAIVASALLLIILSMFIAALQMQYVSTFTFDPNSWLSEPIRNTILSFREERMFEIFKIPIAIIASIALGKFVITKTKQKNTSPISHLIVSGLVSIILISGMASTFLGFEYYYNQTQTNLLSSSELNIINTLQNNIYANGKAIIISPQTPTSYLDFTGATAIVTESTAAWTSESPELPLFVTRYAETTPTFIYLNKIRDYPKLSDYGGNYLAYLSNMTSTYLENSEVQIKEINNTSIPTPNSSSALIVPYDASTMSVTEPLYQQEESQYTIASLFFQQSLQSMNSYPKPINYTNVQINETASFSGINSYIRINGTQTNPDRILIDFQFQPLNLTRNQVIVSKFDWGTPPKKSWEIAQYGKSLGFKLSPDGENEVVLATPDMLQLGTEYTITCEYDGASMKIFANNRILATRSYKGGIFKSNIDLTIGAELYNNRPTSYAKMLLKYIRILNDIPPVTTPIFYVYDLLSLIGLNYTTVESSDNTLGTYKTLILPYDDITTQELLANIENYQQSNVRYMAIINTNGYGPLLDMFGNKTSETFVADKILTDQNYTIQPSVEVPKIDPNEDTKMKAQYVNDNQSSPLVMTTTQGQLTLIYVNIYPLLSQNQLFNPILQQTLAKTLGNYIELYDTTTVTPWFTEPSLLFTNLTANGTVSVQSNSLASIELPENQTLNTNSYNTILIKSTKITVQRGYGFYTTLIASNPNITLKGNQTTSATINGNATLLLRQPEISVNGAIQFENFYTLHPPTIYADGRTTTLSGNITLNIYVSDEYTIALPYKLNSPITVNYQTPLMEFDEITSLISLLPYVLLIAIFALPILFIQRSKAVDSEGNQKRQND